MRFIGDVHGRTAEYAALAYSAGASVQLGDFGHDLSCLARLDPSLHRILSGNHDAPAGPHFLGDFGWLTVPGGGEAFYVRGAATPPAARGPDWHPGEELGWAECRLALEAYMARRPRLVFSHAAPVRVAERLVGPLEATRTDMLLQAMLDAHRPEVWLFGHWHRDWDAVIEGARFICLDVLSYADYDGAFLNVTQAGRLA